MNHRNTATVGPAIYAERLARVRAEMRSQSVDALVVSVGFDLPFLVGYLVSALVLVLYCS